MKKSLLFLIVVMLVVSFGFAKVYRVGTSAGFPPFEYVENGEYVGFDMDLMREMAKEMGDNNNLSNGKIKLMINGKEITPKKNKNDFDKKNTKFLPIDFSKDNLKKWKELSKEEPKSNIKRVDNKINYEIEIPEVRSIQDVSIIKLENSLEVRAVGEKKAYIKKIPIDLPLKKYSLLKGLLTLEMDAE